MSSLRDWLEEAFWLLPTLCVVAASGLALGLLEVDRSLTVSGAQFVFTGGPDAARSLLSTIATSVLSLTGVVFSATLVVLSLTATSYSPRVLPTFLRDRGNQLTLGILIGTFVYALLVLRAVRGEDVSVNQFVPGIAVAGGFVLALMSVAMFGRYIHDITQSIRAVNIVGRIAAQTRETIDRRYPPGQQLAQRDCVMPPEARAPQVVTADAVGVIADLDVDRLVQVAGRHDCVLWLVPKVGDFVPEDAPLFRVDGGRDVDVQRLRGHVTFAQERSMRLDTAFGLRGLVDIAERALSPGVNDPTTAVQCLDQLHDLLRRLACRRFPSGLHTDDQGRVRLVTREPSWSDYVHLALDEIRHWGAGSLQVHQRLRTLLDDLLSVAPADRRAPLVEQQQLLEVRLRQDLPQPEQSVAQR